MGDVITNLQDLRDDMDVLRRLRVYYRSWVKLVAFNELLCAKGVINTYLSTPYKYRATIQDIQTHRVFSVF